MPELPSIEVIRAAGDLWRQTGRTITAAFGGSSMEPTIHDGEPVRVCCGARVTRGDIVLFFYLDRMVVHRVIAANSTTVLTAGDAHRLPDPFLIPRAAIIGTVKGVQRGGIEVEPGVAPSRGISRLTRWIFQVAFAWTPRGATALVRARRRLEQKGDAR